MTSLASPRSRRTTPTSKSVALAYLSMSVDLNVFQFRESADGEADNLHPAQPELLLQLLQVLHIVLQKTYGGGFDPSFQFVGQQIPCNTIRCSDKATGLPNDNLCISFVENFGNSRYINDLSAYDARTLLLQLLLVLVSESRQTLAILDYLASVELREEDVWLRDDIRIAWITVLFASRGYSEPHVAATYQVLGLHPEKVFAAMQAYDQALLGKGPSRSVLAKAAKAGIA